MTTGLVDVPSIDLTDPETFRDGPPHAFFTTLRAQQPVWRHPAGPQRPAFWVLTRYDDVRNVLLQPETFINAKGITVEPGEPAGASANEEERGQGALSYTDPPEHGDLRRVMARHFTPAKVRGLRPVVDAHARGLVGQLLESGGGNFMTVVAEPYPLRVLAAILDLPAETEAAMRSYVTINDKRGEPDFAQQAQDAKDDYLTAVFELARVRAERPGDDLISDIVAGSSDGAKMAAGRIGGILIQLAIAGNETTRAAAGHGMKAFSVHPDAWHEVLADRRVLPGAIEEVLRYSPPVQYTRRTVSGEATIGSDETQTLRSDDLVYLSIASANRDESVFDGPERFDIHRDWSLRPHLSFAVGAHFCLGAALSRLELASLFTTVADLIPQFRVADQASDRASRQFINTLDELPITL